MRISLVLPAIASLVQMRLAMSFAKFSTLRSLNQGDMSEGEYSPEHRHVVRQYSWAVRNVARVIPGATCLVQALAMQRLLKRRGVRSSVRIGVARSPEGTFQSHAWLERDNEVFLGGLNRERFTPIADLDVTAV